MDYPRIGLRTKLTAALILSAGVAVLSAAALTMRHSYGALKTQKQQDELAIARNLALQLDDVLAHARETVEILGALPEVRTMEPGRQRAALTLVTRVTGLIDGFFVTDLQGRVVLMDEAQPDTRRLLPESPRRQIVDPVLASGRAEFSRAYRSRSGEVTLSISAPIRSGGNIVGVLSGGILTGNHSLGGIDSVRIGKSGYAYIIDDAGRAIVHPRRDKLLADFSAHPAAKELTARREGVIEFENEDGVTVLAAFAPLASAPWGVVVRQPATESYALADRLYYFLVPAFLGSLACASILGVALARHLTRPVEALARGARDVADGRLDTRIVPTSSDELGDLAAAFNEMTAKLRKTARSEKLSAVGQLAAGLAHEIHNPLTVISGFAEHLLGRAAEDDRSRPALEDIGREAERCRRLVGQLLDFARPKEPLRAPSDLNALASGVAALVRAQASAQGVEISLVRAPELPLAEVDEDQIKQVLLNLCLNACQAMPDGGALRVSTARRGSSVEISVADTGPGVPPETAKNLFTPFFTTKAEGTGLGLATSHALVESHGGSIQVESRPGAGAVFTVVLPAMEPARA